MTPNNFRVKNGLIVGNNANITGYVNASSYVNATSFNVGATVIANTTGVYATHLNGASASGYALLTGALFTGTVNAATVSVGTSFIANTTRVVVGTSTGLQANGGIGSAGEVLHSNGTTVYWAADDQGVTSVAAANGLNGGTITSTGTISVLGGSTLTVNTTGVHVNSTLSLTDLTLSGNLTVSGTRTYVNTTTLDVGDNIITLNADLGAVAPTQDAGMEIMRGTSANVQFLWDETNDRWSTNGQPLAVSSLIAAGAASGITTLAAGNTTITGFANVSFGSGGGLTGPGSGSWAGKFVTNQDTTAYNGLSVQNRWAAATSVIFEAAMGWNGTAAGYFPVFTVDGLGQVTINSNAPQTFVMGTYANGNVGFGNNAPAHKVSIAGTLAAGNTTITGFASVASARGGIAAPTLGQQNSSFYVTNSDSNYGLLFGVDPATGRGWIQTQRVDGSATAYALRLNPSGGATEFGAGYNETEVANTAATGTYTMNCSAANFFDLTLTGNITISPSNVPPSTRVWSGSIAAKQDATGGRTITWPTGTKYAGGVAPPATTTANALDIWSLMTYDGGTSWIVSLSVKNAA